MADFSQLYPEVSSSIVNGTHEELYHYIRFGGEDLILNDQRRAFSDEYVNLDLIRCGCFVELSARNQLSANETVGIEDLKRTPCILISPREQQSVEEDYYRNTLGFGCSFLFRKTEGGGKNQTLRHFLP